MRVLFDSQIAHLRLFSFLLKRWGQKHSSFHGECDLVMVHSDSFYDGVGLDLHVRTTIENFFSYIETAALRVGENILNFHKDYIYVNGFRILSSSLPVNFGGDFKFTVSSPKLDPNKNSMFYQNFVVDLQGESTITFRFYKKYLTIDIRGHRRDFGDSVGLLGEFATGAMIDRDGNLVDTFEHLGFEWQVAPSDPKLFVEERDRAPQLPFEMCRLPTAARSERRMLRKDDAWLEKAHKACAHISGSDFDLCVDDVLMTRDIGLADLW